MTTVYGVTRYGATDQIKRQLRDMGIPHDKVLVHFNLKMICISNFRHFRLPNTLQTVPLKVWIQPLKIPCNENCYFANLYLLLGFKFLPILPF